MFLHSAAGRTRSCPASIAAACVEYFCGAHRLPLHPFLRQGVHTAVQNGAHNPPRDKNRHVNNCIYDLGGHTKLPCVHSCHLRGFFLRRTSATAAPFPEARRTYSSPERSPQPAPRQKSPRYSNNCIYDLGGRTKLPCVHTCRLRGVFLRRASATAAPSPEARRTYSSPERSPQPTPRQKSPR